MDHNVYNQYIGQLQVIENCIALYYRQHPNLTDYQADEVINNVLRGYMGKKALAKLSETQQVLAESLTASCKSLLGEDFSSKELMKCLKTIRSSLQFWTKENGRQGYLNYMNEFIP